jgi:hypothetical protein
MPMSINGDGGFEPRRRVVKAAYLEAALVGSFVAGLAVAGMFWGRQVKALLRRAVPYVRNRSAVRSPALIVNRWSGDGRAEWVGLADAARLAGAKVIMLERGDDLAQLAHDAISAGADAVGMAGGDGSLGLVAGVAIERGVPFFCVPVGTRNHFALDLGLDRDDPLSALEALSDGEEILIDYAVAGDRIFLNNVSFGLYAQAVHREGYREEKEATMAAVLAEAATDERACTHRSPLSGRRRGRLTDRGRYRRAGRGSGSNVEAVKEMQRRSMTSYESWAQSAQRGVREARRCDYRIR